MSNLTPKQQIVLDAINSQPEAANDDMLLFSIIWAKTWDSSESLYNNLSQQMHPETITRRRRELYQMGLIKYSDDKLKDRDEAFKKELDRHSEYSQAFNNMFESDDLIESFPKLEKTKIEEHYEAVSWLND